ncbi:hypothetical protein KJ781_05330 [Patescibacteria group bacterium]|nr:hypothetical protein [Patescibacteria group bacterium]
MGIALRFLEAGLAAAGGAAGGYQKHLDELETMRGEQRAEARVKRLEKQRADIRKGERAEDREQQLGDRATASDQYDTRLSESRAYSAQLGEQARSDASYEAQEKHRLAQSARDIEESKKREADRKKELEDARNETPDQKEVRQVREWNEFRKANPLEYYAIDEMGISEPNIAKSPSYKAWRTSNKTAIEALSEAGNWKPPLGAPQSEGLSVKQFTITPGPASADRAPRDLGAEPAGEQPAPPVTTPRVTRGLGEEDVESPVTTPSDAKREETTPFEVRGYGTIELTPAEVQTIKIKARGWGYDPDDPQQFTEAIRHALEIQARKKGGAPNREILERGKNALLSADRALSWGVRGTKGAIGQGLGAAGDAKDYLLDAARGGDSTPMEDIISRPYR